MKPFAKHAAILGLLLAFVCAGCHKSGLQESGASVPADIQPVLNVYFQAMQAKDIAKIQDLSAYIPVAQQQGMDERGLDLMRDSKRKIAAEAFKKMTDMFGDLESYSVVSTKETTITPEELQAAKMQGLPLQGIHAEVICKAKFSKQGSAMIRLNLFKESPDSDFSIEAWNYEARL